MVTEGSGAGGEHDALLAEDPAEDAAFERLLRQVAHTAVADDIHPGTVIAGQFELQGELGRGGMGVVLLARDLRLDREVAIKVMRFDRWPAERWPRLREIFLREAKATARLAHPNIVTLLHFGEDHGQLYLVLERLRGEGLDARLSRGRLALEEALEIGIQIARAVAYAHRMQVLHRDLKPHNVFLAEDGRARVLDFGLAALLGEADARATEPTHAEPAGPRAVAARARGDAPLTTRQAGTPGYMAPEQYRGDAQDIRTDVWALGVCVFELLAGRPPFAARTIDDLRVAPELAALAPAVPGPIADAVQRCLAFDPAARPSSVDGLLRALEAGRSRPQRRQVLAMGAAAVVGLGLGLSWLTQRGPSAGDFDLEGTWAYAPGGTDRVMLWRRAGDRYLFEFSDAEPGTRPSVANFYIRGELRLERVDGKLVLRGDLIDVPGWGKGQVGRVEFDVLADDRLYMTRSVWGPSRTAYTFSYPPWPLVKVDARPRDLALSE